MAIIDADGLFNGDRISKCSQMARLYWPYFFLASNGFGRIEINYPRLTSRLFSSFDTPPSEQQVLMFFREYYENFLIFLYECDGQLWGQWDTPSNLLPRHKTASDRKSPAPPEAELAQWKERYTNRRSIRVVDLEKFPKSSELFKTNVHGVGVGDGVGIGVGDGVGVPPADGPRTVFQIATSHPKLSHLKDESEIPYGVVGKILDAIKIDGAEAVLEGTRGWAAQLDNPKFAQKPYDFFNEHQYRPEAWQRGERQTAIGRLLETVSETSDEPFGIDGTTRTSESQERRVPPSIR